MHPLGCLGGEANSLVRVVEVLVLPPEAALPVDVPAAGAVDGGVVDGAVAQLAQVGVAAAVEPEHLEARAAHVVVEKLQAPLKSWNEIGVFSEGLNTIEIYK